MGRRNRADRKASAAGDRRTTVAGWPSAPGLAGASIADWRTWVLAVVVVGATFAVFLPNLDHQFVDWDDRDNFLRNPNYRGLGPVQLKWMWTTFHMGHYMPLTWMSLGLDYQLWGMDPRGYHLTNNILHALNAGLFFAIAIRLIGCVGSAGPARSWGVLMGAVFAALLFGVHPLRVESVSWATERRDLLSAAFMFLSALAYLRFARAGGRRLRWYAAAWALFLSACLSKVIVVMLPLLLIVLDWHPLRRLRQENGRWITRRNALVLVEKGPFFLVSLIFGLVASIGQAANNWLYPLSAHPMTNRIAQSFYGLVFYLWKTFIPTTLKPIYELPIPFNPLEARFILSALAVVACAIGLWRIRHRASGPVAAALVYGIALAPVLGLAQNGSQIVADRYSYLPCLGWAVLAGAAVRRILDDARIRRWGRPALAVAAPAALGSLAVLTWRQTLVWRDTASLWTYAVRVEPTSTFANNSYGFVLFSQGRAEEALTYYRRALAIQSFHSTAHVNLWDALKDLGRSDEMIEECRRTLATNPRFVLAHDRLCRELIDRRRLDEAESAVQAMRRHCPLAPESYVNEGHLRRVQGRLEEAKTAYARALALNREQATAHWGVALIVEREGDVDLALRGYRTAVAILPTFSAARKSLVQALRKTGRLEEALAEAEAWLELEPNSGEAQKQRGEILAALGRSS